MSIELFTQKTPEQEAPTQEIKIANVYNASPDKENPLNQRNIAWLEVINAAGFPESLPVELHEPVTEYPYLGTGRCIDKNNIKVLNNDFPNHPEKGQVEVFLDVKEDDKNQKPHGYIEFQ